MKCFCVYSNEIETRLDPYFFKKEFKMDFGKFEIKSFEEIFNVITDGDHGNPKYSNEGITYLRVIDVENGELLKNNILKLDESYSNRLYKSCFSKENDLLISIVGTLGKSIIVKKEDLPLAVSRGFAILSAKKEPEMKLKYVYYFTKTNLFQKQMDKNKVGSVQTGVYLSSLKQIKIPKPPLDLQNKIINLMERTNKIAKQKKTEAEQLLDSINSYVLQELRVEILELKGQLCYTVNYQEVQNSRLDTYYYLPKFITSEENLEKSPFRIYLLGELIEEISGGATPKVDKNYYTDSSGIPFLRVQNISPLRIVSEDTKYVKREVHEGMLKRSQLKKDDLVFTITGRIGSVAVIPPNFEGNINQHSVRFHLKKSVDNTVIIPYYIAVFLNTSLCNLLSVRKATGGTRPALDYTAIKTIKVPVPPENIQQKIATEVKSKMQKADQLQQEAKGIIKRAKEEVEKIILGK